MRQKTAAAGFPARIRELMGSESRKGFGRRLGVGHTHVTAWLNGSVPSARYLRRISDKLGVTVDWLLSVPNAPKLRTQTREPAPFELDFTAYMARNVVDRLGAQYPRLSPDALAVDVGGLLIHLVEQEAEGLKRWMDVRATMMRASKVASAFQQLITDNAGKLGLTKDQVRRGWNQIWYALQRPQELPPFVTVRPDAKPID